MPNADCRLRICPEQGARLLAETELAISRCAGFTSTKRRCGTFRERLDVSPTEFRRAVRQTPQAQ